MTQAGVLRAVCVSFCKKTQPASRESFRNQHRDTQTDRPIVVWLDRSRQTESSNKEKRSKAKRRVHTSTTGFKRINTDDTNPSQPQRDFPTHTQSYTKGTTIPTPPLPSPPLSSPIPQTNMTATVTAQDRLDQQLARYRKVKAAEAGKSAEKVVDFTPDSVPEDPQNLNDRSTTASKNGDDNQFCFTLGTDGKVVVEVSLWERYGVMELSSTLYKEGGNDSGGILSFRRRKTNEGDEMMRPGAELKACIDELSKEIRRTSQQELVMAIRTTTVVLLRQTQISVMEEDNLEEFSRIMDEIETTTLMASEKLQQAHEVDQEQSKNSGFLQSMRRNSLSAASNTGASTGSRRTRNANAGGTSRSRTPTGPRRLSGR